MKYPIITYSGDDKKPWVLVKDFTIVLSNGDAAIIPKGFWTDFASTPLFINPLGKGINSYVLHDYMYCFEGYKTTDGEHRTNVPVTRKFSDKEMRYQMKKAGVSKIKVLLYYLAVRIFG